MRWIDDVAIVKSTRAVSFRFIAPTVLLPRAPFTEEIIGLLLFWWFPPAWFLGGWLVGLGGGALIGEAMKRSGVDEKLVNQVKSELTPGTSALLLIGATGDVDEMTRAFDQHHPVKVIREPLTDEAIENLKKEFETKA